MEEGTVKSWDDVKGYGFIGRPGEMDVFLHISEVKGRWRPQREDLVSFDIEKDPNGRLRAKNVQLISFLD